MHFLNRIARSVDSTVVTGEFNPRLQSFPRQRLVEHVHGALFEIIASTKGDYFNCKMVTKSGKQRHHAAIQFCAILDELATQQRFAHFRLFADALGIYLRFDQALRAGDLETARKIYFERWLPSLGAAPWRFNPDSVRGQAATAASDDELRQLRINLFVDLPKVADTSIGLFSTPFVGQSSFCNTAGAEKAHQATKNHFSRHSSFNMTSGNISSLNMDERRRVAMVVGAEELAAHVNAARIRARPGGSGLFAFVAAGSEAIDLPQWPPVIAELILAINPRAKSARSGRLRLQFSDSSTTVLSRSTSVCPTFLRVEIAENPVSADARDLATCRDVPIIELLGVYFSGEMLCLHVRFCVAAERLTQRPWTVLRSTQRESSLCSPLISSWRRQSTARATFSIL